MDDKRLEKIKKTLGLAHSDELNERASAIRQAGAFMRRDGVSLMDLLNYLGKDNYFFTPLVDLARALADSEHPPGEARRTKFEELMGQINRHFFGTAGQGQSQSQGREKGGRSHDDEDDAAAAKQRAEEAERERRNRQQSSSSSTGQQKAKGFADPKPPASPKPETPPFLDRIHAFFDVVEGVIDRTKRVLDTVADFSLWGLAKGLFFLWLLYILVVPALQTFFFGDGHSQEKQVTQPPVEQPAPVTDPAPAPASAPSIEPAALNALPMPVSFRAVSKEEAKAIFDAFINAMNFSPNSPFSLATISDLYSSDVVLEPYDDRSMVMMFMSLIADKQYSECSMELTDNIHYSDVDSGNGLTLTTKIRRRCRAMNTQVSQDIDRIYDLKVRVDLRDGEPRITNVSGITQ